MMLHKQRYRLYDSFRRLLGVASLALCGLAVTVPAQAVPSFARQTGLPCASCHTVFPELTRLRSQFQTAWLYAHRHQGDHRGVHQIRQCAEAEFHTAALGDDAGVLYPRAELAERQPE